ncbi:hypothetical protein ABID22_003709 [Pontibacter aydingkolensis]|uniref:Secreted protein n=1 Tax=Pontibacter aydingkolensis TaxID=1911536 RepID=A0ABS7CZ96_9BACT|nr:hypothetical protein [Pontibacter aydingkolensis]MBW7469006.1 hypothetical protein [Pontibacter aydingkolensis]
MATTRLFLFLGIALIFSLLTSCKTCPIYTCHVRMVHAHGEEEFRGQPLWKKQNPKVGEKLPKASKEKAPSRTNKSKNKN